MTTSMSMIAPVWLADSSRLTTSVKSAEFKYWLRDSRDKVCPPNQVDEWRDDDLTTSFLIDTFHYLPIKYVANVGIYRDEF